MAAHVPIPEQDQEHDVTMRFHLRTFDAITIVLTDEDGLDIPDSLVARAWFGSAWRPPEESELKVCPWITPPAPERAFALDVQPEVQGLTAGVYRVWYRVATPTYMPLLRVDEQVVLFGD